MGGLHIGSYEVYFLRHTHSPSFTQTQCSMSAMLKWKVAALQRTVVVAGFLTHGVPFGRYMVLVKHIEYRVYGDLL